MAGLYRGRTGTKHKCHLRYPGHVHRPGGTYWRCASFWFHNSGLGIAGDKDTLAREDKAGLLPSRQDDPTETFLGDI